MFISDDLFPQNMEKFWWVLLSNTTVYPYSVSNEVY